ncbi:MAG TPA: hypothetical protein VIC35_10620, partial [Acidimicrobiia bacterium]
RFRCRELRPAPAEPPPRSGTVARMGKKSSGPPKPELTEQEAFEALLVGLLSVPKKEVDARRARKDQAKK